MIELGIVGYSLKVLFEPRQPWAANTVTRIFMHRVFVCQGCHGYHANPVIPLPWTGRLIG